MNNCNSYYDCMDYVCRSHSSKVGGEGVELEEEPSRQRRRFDNTEVKGYLAGLKRKQMLLRQDRYGGTVCVCVCVCVSETDCL